MRRVFAVTICSAICCIFFVGVGPAAAIDCNTLPPRTPVTLDSITTYSFGTFGGSDCWGWGAPDGREYAIMGVHDGLAFVNVTDDQIVGTIPGPTSGCGSVRWRDMETYRNYCYCVSECSGTNGGMMIVDMQYLPDSVHLVGTVSTGTSHNMWIDTTMGFAYVLLSNASGFRVFDLTDPEAPVAVSLVSTGDIHDIFVRNDTAWVPEGNRGTWSAWDMSDKSNPQLIVRVPIPNSGYVHNIWASEDGLHVVTTEETANKTMKIWDVSNYANVGLVSEFIASSHLAHNAHWMGDYIITSHYESGIQVVDVTTPECPLEVSQFDTYPPAESPNFNGAWGAFPFTTSGKIYGSNDNGKLFVIQSDISPVRFEALPRVGFAPLAVSFSDATPGALGNWVWEFGDGDTAVGQTAAHTYTAGGLYDVGLSVTTVSGDHAGSKSNFVTVLADTLIVADTAFEVGIAATWDIYGTNAVPISEMVLPITLTNVPVVVMFDSVSFVGTRLDYFEHSQVVFDNRFNGQLAVQVRADNGGGSPPLPPGSGVIARVFLRTHPAASPGDTSHISVGPLGSQNYSATTLTATFAPVFEGGTLTIQAPPCDCADHGDSDPNGVLDALDLAFFIDHVFFEGAQPPIDPVCPHLDRGDFNCDGVDDSVDLAALIDAIFFNGAGPCDPCACSPYPTSCP